jgi:beta-lactamase regulating signal transducer with metallopeptidase domain
MAQFRRQRIAVAVLLLGVAGCVMLATGMQVWYASVHGRSRKQVRSRDLDLVTV